MISLLPWVAKQRQDGALRVASPRLAGQRRATPRNAARRIALPASPAAVEQSSGGRQARR
jgi:hypothetical protein